MPGGTRDTGQLPRSEQLDIDADAILPAMTFRGHEMDALSDRSRYRVRPMTSGRATLKTPSEVVLIAAPKPTSRSIRNPP